MLRPLVLYLEVLAVGCVNRATLERMSQSVKADLSWVGEPRTGAGSGDPGRRFLAHLFASGAGRRAYLEDYCAQYTK